MEGVVDAAEKCFPTTSEDIRIYALWNALTKLGEVKKNEGP